MCKRPRDFFYKKVQIGLLTNFPSDRTFCPKISKNRVSSTSDDTFFYKKMQKKLQDSKKSANFVRFL